MNGRISGIMAQTRQGAESEPPGGLGRFNHYRCSLGWRID
jgi:hypothetical protein